MAWIQTVEPQDATGELKKFYDQLIENIGGVANILKVSSLQPQLLKAQAAYFGTLMHGDSPLSRPRRELIAVTVSVLNRCHY